MNDKKEKNIKIQGVPETMLQTLYARAKESQKEPHFIYDEKAIEIAGQLDYDFSLAEKDAVMSSGVIARTIVLDKMVNEYLAAHPGAVVVNLACGLDTRCYRTTGKYKRWYNLDLPEAMAVRRRFFQEDGPIFQITASAMDAVWAAAVTQEREPTLIILEGLTMYLSETEVQQIFHIIGERFPRATVFVETMSPFMVRHIKEKSIAGSQAKFTWGVWGGKELASLIPPFRSVKDVSLTEGMQVFAPIYRLLGRFSLVRRMSNQILVMEALH